MVSVITILRWDEAKEGSVAPVPGSYEGEGRLAGGTVVGYLFTVISWSSRSRYEEKLSSGAALA